MSAKKNLIYCQRNVAPTWSWQNFQRTVNKLAIKTNDNRFEVRCVSCLALGTINERRHRLHEVVRLSGINVSVDNDDMPLQIKVASFPAPRLQVYFLENEDLCSAKIHLSWWDWKMVSTIMASRTIFFCRGALETVKKFGWPPWHYSLQWLDDRDLFPHYLKTVLQKEPVFAHSKIVYTDWAEYVQRKTGYMIFSRKALIHPTLKDKGSGTIQRSQ